LETMLKGTDSKKGGNHFTIEKKGEGILRKGKKKLFTRGRSRGPLQVYVDIGENGHKHIEQTGGNLVIDSMGKKIWELNFKGKRTKEK